MEERQILESIAADMGSVNPENMSDTELISFICDR